MIENALLGWVIQMAIPANPEVRAVGAPWRDPSWRGTPPSFRYFNVAIAAPDQAMQATASYSARAADPIVGIVSIARKLSSQEIVALGLTAGEVKPA